MIPPQGLSSSLAMCNQRLDQPSHQQQVQLPRHKRQARRYLLQPVLRQPTFQRFKQPVMRSVQSLQLLPHKVVRNWLKTNCKFIKPKRRLRNRVLWVLLIKLRRQQAVLQALHQVPRKVLSLQASHHHLLKHVQVRLQAQPRRL